MDTPRPSAALDQMRRMQINASVGSERARNATFMYEKC
jgi:hypothetical protein